MTDVHEPEVRSYNMSRIRGKDTKPELLVRKFLFGRGLRYRLHDKRLPGKPDIILPKYKTIVFVHGCFWHGHDGCKYYVIPKTRTDWWKEKIERTKTKDQQNIEELESMDWKVLVVYECELKPDRRENTLNSLLEEIINGNPGN